MISTLEAELYNFQNRQYTPAKPQTNISAKITDEVGQIVGRGLR